MIRRSTSVLLVALLPVLTTGCTSSPPEEDASANTGDSAAVDTAADSTAAEARVETFYVHLRADVDPREFAASRELTVVEVIDGRRPGLVTRLTPDERSALEADSLVRSLARRIHPSGEEKEGPAIRPLGGDSAGG
ncbi:MAG: hypothetical protein Q8W44_06045 [Candidatus Palauibacterales bacterium]|nr:hypothetical protein [Candidatus Palauibacterales bacterium]